MHLLQSFAIVPYMDAARGVAVTGARMIEEKKPKPRGLAAMTAERRKEIATMGGKATQKSGKANKFTTESAVAALKKRYEKS